MIKCSYCGQEYPDNVTVCPSDAQPLGNASPTADETTPTGPDTEESDDFQAPGKFDVMEAERLLKNLNRPNFALKSTAMIRPCSKCH